MTNLYQPDIDDIEVIFIDSLKGSIFASLLFFLFFMKGGLIR
jgi:hypothetical protein